jgi:hypothetical protein
MRIRSSNCDLSIAAAHVSVSAQVDPGIADLAPYRTECVFGSAELSLPDGVV